MILLTDTFGVEQIEAACTVSIEKVEIAEVQAALAQAKVFDVYFEFEELALDAQDVLGVEVPETRMQHLPRFKDDFTLIVVGYENVEKDNWQVTFWKVQDVAPYPDDAEDAAGAAERAARNAAYAKDFSEYIALDMDRNKDE